MYAIILLYMRKLEDGRSTNGVSCDPHIHGVPVGAHSHHHQQKSQATNPHKTVTGVTNYAHMINGTKKESLKMCPRRLDYASARTNTRHHQLDTRPVPMLGARCSIPAHNVWLR